MSWPSFEEFGTCSRTLFLRPGLGRIQTSIPGVQHANPHGLPPLPAPCMVLIGGIYKGAATGRRLIKNEFTVYKQNSQFSRSVQYVNGCKNVLKLNTCIQ